MKTKLMWCVLLGVWVLALPACDVINPEVTGTPKVTQMMPDLPGYKIIESQSIQDYIMTLSEGGALLSGHPELAALLVKLDGVIECYREVGAVDARIYSDQSFQLSSGAVAIADRDRLTDPRTLFRCVGGEGVLPFSAQPSVDPCYHSYTLTQDGNEFYIVYMGTTSEICHACCTTLPGCTRHYTKKGRLSRGGLFC